MQRLATDEQFPLLHAFGSRLRLPHVIAAVAYDHRGKRLQRLLRRSTRTSGSIDERRREPERQSDPAMLLRSLGSRATHIARAEKKIAVPLRSNDTSRMPPVCHEKLTLSTSETAD